MSMKEKSTIREGSYKHFFSFLELVVVTLVIGFLIAIGTMVWSNIKDKAYDARAQANHSLAEEATICFWVAVGQERGSYDTFTAEYMNESEPGLRWIEGEAALLYEGEIDNVPSDYYASIIIIQDGTSRDEVMVATISETGKVFCTYFEKETPSFSAELAYAELNALEKSTMSADSGSGLNLESSLHGIENVKNH